MTHELSLSIGDRRDGFRLCRIVPFPGLRAEAREFELEGEEAIVRKEGDRLIVEPVRKGRLQALLSTLEPLDEALPDVDEDLPQLDDVAL